MLNSCNPTLASFLFSLSLLMLASRRPVSPSGTANRQAANRIEETARTDAAPAGEGKTRWQLLVRAAMGARAETRERARRVDLCAFAFAGLDFGLAQGQQNGSSVFFCRLFLLVLSCPVSSRLVSSRYRVLIIACIVLFLN